MINNVADIGQQSAIILLYPSGASGEFIASALSESIESFAKTDTTFENQNRVKYLDFLGRSLNSGDKVLNHQLIVERANNFLTQCTTGRYIILSHRDPSSVNFIHEFLPQLPLVEIVIHQPKSRLFRKLAASQKIPKEFKFADKNYNYDVMPGECGQVFQKHLKIEWEDLILTNTDQEYNKITEFLSTTGNITIFKSMLADYVERNKDYLDQLNES